MYWLHFLYYIASWDSWSVWWTSFIFAYLHLAESSHTLQQLHRCLSQLSHSQISTDRTFFPFPWPQSSSGPAPAPRRSASSPLCSVIAIPPPGFWLLASGFMCSGSNHRCLLVVFLFLVILGWFLRGRVGWKPSLLFFCHLETWNALIYKIFIILL